MCFQSLTADFFAGGSVWLRVAEMVNVLFQHISAYFSKVRAPKSMQVLFPDANVEFAVTALYQASMGSLCVVIAGIHSRQGDSPQY